jgi:mRNA-degrading endonuclease RelE of RelBE toxin-antitoxin system
VGDDLEGRWRYETRGVRIAVRFQWERRVIEVIAVEKA